MAKQSLVREKGENNHRVTYAELFFDLVFVLAIIMISHSLVEHFTLKGIVETTILLLVVWWAWIYTCWATNWLDPEKTAVRLMLFTAMFAGIILTISIPYAFTKKALVFALAYVFMQLGRSLFMVWAFKGQSRLHMRNFIRISIWFSISGIFWIAGGVIEEYRLLLWIVALGIEYLSPLINMWLPFMGRSKTTEWNIEGAHMAERCALFIIIAIGETILVIGRSFSELEWDVPHISAFFIAFIGTITLWWIYFNISAEKGSKKISTSDDPGRIGRLVYTYIHILIIAGIILVAAADEIILLHPLDGVDKIAAIAIIGGPLVYLIGNLWFKKTMFGVYVKSHLVGIVLLCLLYFGFDFFAPVFTAGIAVGILLMVSIWETLLCKG